MYNSESSFQILSMHPEKSLANQLMRDLNMMETKTLLPQIKFPDLINYADQKTIGALLNLTEIVIGVAELDTEFTLGTCQDNEVKLIGGKNSGLFIFGTNFNITNGEKNYTGECIFTLNAVDLLISKEFGFNKNKPAVVGKIHLDFSFVDFKISANETEEISDFLESALRSYVDTTITPVVNTRLQKELNDYYSNAYINNLVLNFTTYQPQREFTLDVNYVDTPETRTDPATQKCGILFKRSGMISGLKINPNAVNFTQFDNLANSIQIFMSKTIFEDVITNVTAKYALRGTITEKTADLLNFPYRMSMKQFAEILPSVLNSFSPADEVESHWTIFDIKLNFDEEKQRVTGSAGLDCTFYANINSPSAKQIYSFDSILNFDIVVDTSEKKFNLVMTNVDVDRLRIRENYGFSNSRLLKNWIRQTFSQSLDFNRFTLYKSPLDISSFYDKDISTKIYSNGILFY